MKQNTSTGRSEPITKQLFEAGQQCLKRLYLDRHEPTDPTSSASRTTHAKAGEQLLTLARSAFPGGVDVKGKSLASKAKKTAELLGSDEAVVLFDAAFTSPDTAVGCDIVLRQRTGELDLFEVKSGARIKPRHLSDMALQVLAIEQCGFKVRAMHILHLNHSYVHAGGDDYPATGLLRSADVTERVRRILPRVERQTAAYRLAAQDESMLELPTGTYCTQPFRCPHLSACAETEPAHPLRLLPELQRQTEADLHEAGVNSIDSLDPSEERWSEPQRHTIEAAHSGTLQVLPLAKEETGLVEFPLHFLAVADFTEPLPHWAGTRPWQAVPYAWAVRSAYEDGRIEHRVASFLGKDDPRPAFCQSLSDQLATGGVIVCWGTENLASIEHMLDGLPSHKQQIRTILGRQHLDLERLLEASVFHTDLPPRRSLEEMAHVLLQLDLPEHHAIRCQESAFAAIQKAATPRIRSTTRDKLAADLEACVDWRSQILMQLYEHLSGRRLAPEQAPAQRTKPAKGSSRKQLPPA